MPSAWNFELPKFETWKLADLRKYANEPMHLLLMAKLLFACWFIFNHTSLILLFNVITEINDGIITEGDDLHFFKIYFFRDKASIIISFSLAISKYFSGLLKYFCKTNVVSFLDSTVSVVSYNRK